MPFDTDTTSGRFIELHNPVYKCNRHGRLRIVGITAESAAVLVYGCTTGGDRSHREDLVRFCTRSAYTTYVGSLGHDLDTVYRTYFYLRRRLTGHYMRRVSIARLGLKGKLRSVCGAFTIWR